MPGRWTSSVRSATCSNRCSRSSRTAAGRGPGDDRRAPVGRPSLAHAGQYRRSGEPYVTHPVAVAQIVAELGLDAPDDRRRPAPRRGRGHRPRRWPRSRSSSARSSRAVVDGVTKLDRLQFDSKEAAAGGDHPQDARRHGQRLAGPAHQAGRPAAQHADAGRDAGVEAAPDGPGDASTSTPRWPTGSASSRSGGSSRTWPSPRCTRSATPRSSRWSRPGRPEREEYLARVLVAVRERLVGTGHRGRGDRPAEAPLEHLREDGRAGQGVRRHPRPGRHPGRRRLREGLLGRARRHPRHLAAGAGPVQGLHQHAEVQPLPVAAHHGHRPRRQADRGPGADARDAPPGRVRHRRPLGLQGEGGRRPRRWPGCSGSPTSTPRRPTRSSSSRR